MRDGREGTWSMSEGGRNGPVGRVGMSGPGGIHGVPRCVGCPARPKAVGVFRWGDGQMGEKVGWIGGGGLLRQRDRIPFRAGRLRRAGNLALVSKKPGIN